MPLFHRAGRGASQQPASAVNIKRVSLERPGTSAWARFRPVVAFVNKYIHKLLGNNNPIVTRLTDRVIRVVSDLSADQKARLQAWVDEAGPDEIQGRREIAEAILSCARTASPDLELSNKGVTTLPDIVAELTQVRRLLVGGNPLISLPESLACMKNLRSLSCDYCGLDEAPDWISDLSNLSYLNLNGNSLTTLPGSVGSMHNLHTLKLVNNNIRYPPSTLWSLGKSHPCHIYLARNPVPPAEQRELHKVRGAGQLYIFCVPRFILTEVNSTEVNTMVAHWFALASLPLPDRVRQMLGNMDSDQARTLGIHLCKLIATKDYETPAQSIGLATRVADVLSEMAEDEEVKNACMAASLEAVSSCADRAMLGLNEMEKAVMFAKINKTGDLNQLVELGAGYEKLEKVKAIAARRCRMMRIFYWLGLGPKPDEIEVQLAYMLGLADRLQLPIAKNQQMLFRKFSTVTDRDIEQAAAEIEKNQAAHPEQEINALLAWQPLYEKLEEQYFGYVDDIRGQYLEKRETIDTHASDYDEQVAEVEREMKAATDSFYREAVQKLREHNPLPPKTREEAQVANAIDQDAARLARERMEEMIRRQRQGRNVPGNPHGEAE